MARQQDGEALGLSDVPVPTLVWALVAAAAGLNLAVGVALALRQPARASDLLEMYDWCRTWLLGQHQLYAGPDASTDYPPNAIVMLSPLALVPWRWVVPIWTAVALALTPLLPYLVVRCTSHRRLFTAAAIPMLLFFCWAGARTLLQFTLLSMTLMFASVLLVDSRWLASGIFLGLALAKPHIAGPIAVWAMLTRRIRVVAVAGVVVLAGVAAYDARVHENPLVTLSGYWHVLVATYGGPEGFIGLTSVRAWAYAITADPRWADTLWAVAAGLLLVVPSWLAVGDSHRSAEGIGMAVPSLFCLWSLLTFYHNGNNLIMMLPAFVFLLLVDDRDTVRQRWLFAAFLQAVLMFDVPIRLKPFAPARGAFRILILDFDRFVVLITFVYIVMLLRRLSQRRADQRDPAVHAGSRRPIPSR